MIFLGELPDKTMFASLVMATRGRPFAVWIGATAAFAVRVVIATTVGVLLTDILFLNVRIVPFTGEQTGEQPTLAASLLKYLAFAPCVAMFPILAEPWIEARATHMAIVAVAIAGATWHCAAVIRPWFGSTATCPRLKPARTISQ